MFVCVDVREFEAGALELLDLCERFTPDIVLMDGAAEDAEREVAEGVSECEAVWTKEGWDGGGIG